MAGTRRVGNRTSKTRAALLSHAEKLMLDEGYAAVTYRAVAARAGVTSGLVQYYFPILDDLFTALVRHRSEQGLALLAEGLAKGPPLRAVWAYASDWIAATLTYELMALSNHRKTIRAEIARAGEEARAMALDALAKAPPSPVPAGPGAVEPAPEVLVFLMTNIPRVMAMEAAAGMTTAHAETIAFVERYLDRLEPLQTPASPGPPCT
ncbi:TetR/AcrR family transcriptional regulator [Streptomyces sp. NPDC004629]|uniref:TetR/AcrR family transcriptional regulator n=1 Tax=Streptomyces sp. NPDC004629 TaxID=3364705 RepID=UPI00368565C0